MTATTNGAAIFALAAVLSAGCAAESPYMRAAGALAPAAADSATVVFARPSAFGSAVAFTILDGHGRFLGDSLPESKFAVRVPPGDHVFIGWAENTAALLARVRAGKTYYVEVAPRMGVASARVQLFAIAPGSNRWADAGTWLANLEPYAVDEAAGQAYLASRTADVVEQVRRAKENLDRYTPEELGERVLRPEDGR